MGRWQEVVGVGREVVGEGGARCDEEARGACCTAAAA